MTLDRGEEAVALARLRAARRVLSPLALIGGVAILLLLGVDAAVGLPVRLPRTVYLHRGLWVLLGLGLAGAGVALGREPSVPAGWKPALPGRRCRRLVVYSREGCHLCDDAKAILAKYIEYLPEIEEQDITHDALLTERFGQIIPVVEMDGLVRFRGRIDEGLLRRWIDATPPQDS